MFGVLATVHLHILHHTLDPLGIVLAALSLLAVVTIVAVGVSTMIRRKTGASSPSGDDPQPAEPTTASGSAKPS